MEKRTPHYALSVVRALIREGQVRATNSAFSDAAHLGFDFKGMLAVIISLKPADFYKSMTTHADHRVWQDVYRPKTASGDVSVFEADGRERCPDRLIQAALILEG